MPSFKACFFGLSLAAIFVSPVSSVAISLQARKELTKRDVGAVPAQSFARAETREEAVERVRLSYMSRAARSVKRGLRPSNCFPPGVTSTPTHGSYQLRSVGCKLICSHSAGYRPSPNNRECVKSVPAISCGDGDIIIKGQKVGVHLLRGNVCETVCYKSTGYTVDGDTCKQAYNPAQDPSHCGSSNTVCPSGYPDGTAACVNGACTLLAPVVNVGKNKAFSNGIATQADDAKYTKKYKELKAKIGEVEEDNTKLQVKILKSKKAISRLRIERAILYDRLQSSALPSNPFSLTSREHLSTLSSSNPTAPPTILDAPSYPLEDPSGPSIYLQALDERKIAAVQQTGSGEDSRWGDRPNTGVANGEVKTEDGGASVVEPVPSASLAGPSAGDQGHVDATNGDGMQVDEVAPTV